jgi:hypothetical protein
MSTREKGITEIKDPPGFLARHYWGKPEPLQEYFYDREYNGSHEDAKAGAMRWLTWARETYPVPPSRVVHGRRSKNKKQPPGVHLPTGVTYGYDVDASGLENPYYAANWRFPGERLQLKKFYWSTYPGPDEARDAAIAFRKDRERKIDASERS